MNPKICFAASCGGHLAELSMLKPLMNKYDSFVVTEHTGYSAAIEAQRIYYVHQVNRKEKSMPFWMLLNSFKSLRIILIEKPDIVITTGVLAVIPLCLLAKLFRKKLIFVESFAKVTTPTKTGKLLYRYADQFYVQWPQMQKIYPNAIYLGGIF